MDYLHTGEHRHLSRLIIPAASAAKLPAPQNKAGKYSERYACCASYHYFDRFWNVPGLNFT